MAGCFLGLFIYHCCFKKKQELKLDFSDVLIRPKRSTLSSRNEVELERTFIFKDRQDI